MSNNRWHNNRRSIRLQGYDYSSPGEYFITICTQNRECLFGDVVDGKMVLNECGKIAEKLWYRIPQRYDHVCLDAFIVMPNHIHGIIGIEFNSGYDSHPVGVIHELPLRDGLYPINRDFDPETYRIKRRNMLLPKIIGWYKMNVSKQANIILHNTGHPFWQRNYYEHIIRNEKSLDRIRDYIANNPMQWEDDRNHPGNMKKNPGNQFMHGMGNT